MRVLMVNHPRWEEYRGGDWITLQKTAESLRALGVEVIENHDPEPNAKGFDIAHVFNLRTYDLTVVQVESIQRSGVPIVLTPFYITLGFSAWAYYALEAVLSLPPSDGNREELLEMYRTRRITVNRPDGKTLMADTALRPILPQQDTARQILARVDCLLPNSLLELDRLRKDLQAPNTPFAIIPLGADANRFLNADPEPFIRRHKLKDFILQVGRLEGHKNQLALAHALRDVDLPLVLIGRLQDEDYVELCRRHGPGHLTILPYLPLEELSSAYAAARVHVLPNWTETCGLVSLEAALAGCNLVCSTAGYELEFFRDLVYYCEPLDYKSIRSVVQLAYENYDRDAPRRTALQELIVRDYNWPRVAAMTLDVYQRVLRNN